MQPIRQAVILAGGEGTRLRPLTLTTPKPLIPIQGKPFIVYLIELLKKNGIEEIIVLTGYLADQFPMTLGDGSRWGLRLHYHKTDASDDTGERLRKAKSLFREEFLLLYGDNFWPLNLEALTEQHRKMQKPATVTVYQRNDPKKKNNMLVEGGLVRVYDKTRETSGCNGVDIGFFILNRNVIDTIPDTNVNFEKTVFPKLIAHNELAAFSTRQPYWGLTDVERLPGVTNALNPGRKILFLDRDGVINKKAPKGEYITSVEQFSFLPHAIESLVELSSKGYELFLISNQAGIARGMMTEEDLTSIHAEMRERLAIAGVILSGIYYCPHGWDSGCDCRKPKPGMFFQAAREHDIDLSRAWFVGDDERDLEAGTAAGVRTILVSPEEGIHAALQKIFTIDSTPLL